MQSFWYDAALVSQHNNYKTVSKNFGWIYIIPLGEPVLKVVILYVKTWKYLMHHNFKF